MSHLLDSLPSISRSAMTPQLLEALLDATPDCLFAYDEAEICLFIGTAMAQAFDLNRAQMLDKPFPLQKICPEFADVLDTRKHEIAKGDRSISGSVTVASASGKRVFNYTVRSLAAHAEQPSATLFRARDITEEYVARMALEDCNRHLTQAMSETHHRVKNNLQIVCSLAEMQMQEADETIPKSALQRINQHVRALAAIHDILTHTPSEDEQKQSIPARELLEQLFPMLQTTLPNRLIHYEIADVVLPTREASALALICNELVNNAAKHGAGEVKIEFNVEGTKAVLKVSDNGKGFPDNFQLETSANTGLDLVQSLAKWDLAGHVRFFNCDTGGACITVEFPLPKS